MIPASPQLLDVTPLNQFVYRRYLGVHGLCSGRSLGRQTPGNSRARAQTATQLTIENPRRN